MRKFHIEGYGCSLNSSDSLSARALLEKNGWREERLERLGRGDAALINTCAVKKRTGHRMAARIGKISAKSEKQGFRTVVFGCMPRISPLEIPSGENMVIAGPGAGALQKAMGLRLNTRPFEQSGGDRNKSSRFRGGAWVTVLTAQ